MKQRRYPAVQLGHVAVALAFGLLWWLERRRPLRRTVEPMSVHQPRNLVMAGLAAVTVQAIEQPLVEPLARLVERRRWGLASRLDGPGWLRTAVVLVLMDYSLYVWHVLTHRVPALWRFHAVHHLDLDLDASTALRFHFGELALSVPWRALQVVAIGATPAQLRLWQQCVLVSILFHHSNLRLPADVERALAWVVTTPRLHGIHHADVGPLRDANWSSGLSIWDRVHGTLRDDVPQEAITVGVAPFTGSDDVSLPRILSLPFRRDRPDLAVARRDGPRST